ncbi:tRNA uridine-5-carboxymethylaminomethyl(34) synthesis enzyme MnmG [Sandaracinobacter neustonicus]|uniref:tRNA uridine-5-carboxymethylaminomethyl(34) synthesis enzyme MnmG n=1 Tax=Sandaracinobacter neustonicus TaxID=1715348 RepID=UPI001A9C9DAF|nr:tRNA uridine-5-carboxymethylaminomethyl(34) synthesis enzyme MnmG [Sandaracinobacter neustonicus]
MKSHDVIVIGGGHAGCEAACAAARTGARVALVTFAADNIGQMSCNPAIGGLGKGHLVREIDAMDGIMGRAADAAGIQFRLLNRSRGAAVQGPRAQADRKRYAAAVRALVADSGVEIVEAEVTDLLVEDGRCTGVETSIGPLPARAVVLTSGTFLGGVMHIGERQIAGGRVGEAGASRLALRLRALGLPMGRLKTGTPPRLDGRTIDWANLEVQSGDAQPAYFSSLTTHSDVPQVDCYITRTTQQTHDVIRGNIGLSPMYAGRIEGVGPRYCPSIEDKVMRFGDRDGHQIFLEPEGLDDPLIYPNGISTSLPELVQAAIIHSIPGLGACRIAQPGYAVEYDYLDPRALDSTLQLQALPGLWLAGQVNGTTGYEEAAAQGLVAGLNATGRHWVPDRATSYIGVMVDDLVTHGVSEPYRMFTSRAEFRLRLRADNADLRLTPIARQLGCLGTRRSSIFSDRLAAVEQLTTALKDTRVPAAAIPEVKGDGIARSLWEWARFPGVDWTVLQRAAPQLSAEPNVVETVLTDASYAVYLDRQEQEVARVRQDEAVIVPRGTIFRDIPGLSNEMAERLQKAQPETLGQAARVRGVTPAAITALLAWIRKTQLSAA